jgi:hypothetical protein
MRKLVLPLALLLAVNALAQTKNNSVKFAEDITANNLKAKLTIIAGAEMEGRETATPGQKRAAAYIENFFKSIGLQPGTADGYQLKYPVYQDSLSNVALTINGVNLSLDKDFNISPSAFITGSWKASEIIFATYGIADSSTNNYSGLDVKDKWVMLLDGTPADGDRPNFRAARAKIMNARTKGAKGIIIISKDFPKAKPALLKGSMYVTKQTGAPMPVITISVNQAATILGKTGGSISDIKNAIRGVYDANFLLSIATTTNTLESSDVIGMLPGTDKKDEYVLITGHYDHLGKRDSVIYYGADDDGSGTTSVMQIAQTFAKAKAKGNGPRRTMVFMTVSGEEEGLWGSDYYTSHPVFALEKTSVDLNTDMVGRIDPDYKGDSLNYVYVIGEDKLSSDLMKISDSINNSTMHLELDRRFNDPKDPNRFYYRSDHFNFAKHGVPVIFYFNGVHKDYHRPTDTVDKINFDLMTKRVKLVFYTAWAMANRDNMLVRDKPLP